MFTNDFAALRPTTGDATCSRTGCSAPRASRAPAGSSASRRATTSRSRGWTPADVRRVVDLWAEQTAELGARYRWVQVFENRGEAMGALEPAPARPGLGGHGPARPASRARTRASARTSPRTGRRLLADVVEQEAAARGSSRTNDDWLVLVPFWAVWPFEVLVIAARPFARMPDLDDAARDALAAILG